MHSIQYISQGSTQQEQLSNIEQVLKAGCTWVQLRFKNADEALFLETAQKAKQLCDRFQAVFIVNDHVAIAKEVDAHGVHVGLTDTNVREAREILGDDKIIGGTTNTFEDVLQRIEENCDYIGLGPFRFTTTKEKLSPVLGLEGYKAIINRLKEANKHIVIYAIGGIEENDIQAILDLGIQGVALSGLLTNTENCETIISKFSHESVVTDSIIEHKS
jgi:thiamine-phosphate pyrophosphorylase